MFEVLKHGKVLKYVARGSASNFGVSGHARSFAIGGMLSQTKMWNVASVAQTSNVVALFFLAGSNIRSFFYLRSRATFYGD